MTHDSSDIGTIAHLPECWFSDPKKVPAVAVNDGWPCICDRLRACEQRVLKDLVPNLTLADMQGYNRALTAAREAVRHVLGPMDTDDPGQRDAALAAIDALRGDRYSDSHQPQVDGTERRYE